MATTNHDRQQEVILLQIRLEASLVELHQLELRAYSSMLLGIESFLERAFYLLDPNLEVKIWLGRMRQGSLIQEILLSVLSSIASEHLSHLLSIIFHYIREKLGLAPSAQAPPALPTPPSLLTDQALTEALGQSTKIILTHHLTSLSIELPNNAPAEIITMSKEVIQNYFAQLTPATTSSVIEQEEQSFSMKQTKLVYHSRDFVSVAGYFVWCDEGQFYKVQPLILDEAFLTQYDKGLANGTHLLADAEGIKIKDSKGWHIGEMRLKNIKIEAKDGN